MIWSYKTLLASREKLSAGQTFVGSWLLPCPQACVWHFIEPLQMEDLPETFVDEVWVFLELLVVTLHVSEPYYQYRFHYSADFHSGQRIAKACWTFSYYSFDVLDCRPGRQTHFPGVTRTIFHHGWPHKRTPCRAIRWCRQLLSGKPYCRTML